MQRDVFYIAGFDPRSYRYYYSLFKRNAKLQSVVNGVELTLAPLNHDDTVNSPYFEVSTPQQTQTHYRFLTWDDLVKANWSENIFSILLDFLYFLRIYIFSGLWVTFARASKTQLIAGLYPSIYLLLCYTLTFSLIFSLFKPIATSTHLIFACLFAVLTLFLATKGIKFVGKKLGVFWLSRIYAFCARCAEDKIADIEHRLDIFADELFQHIKANKHQSNYELILSAHSVGTILAVSVAARTLTRCQQANIDTSCFKLLTLGQCIPLVSFQKRANRFRDELQLLADQDNFYWYDFTSKIDGACFPLVDYLRTSGVTVAENHGPRYLSTRFFKLFTATTYKKIRRDWYKAHFLYLMATEIKGQYDYFDFVVGDNKLERKIQ